MNNEVAVADLYFDPDLLDDLTDSELLEQIEIVEQLSEKLESIKVCL